MLLGFHPSSFANFLSFPGSNPGHEHNGVLIILFPHSKTSFQLLTKVNAAQLFGHILYVESHLLPSTQLDPIWSLAGAMSTCFLCLNTMPAFPPSTTLLLLFPVCNMAHRSTLSSRLGSNAAASRHKSRSLRPEAFCPAQGCPVCTISASPA